MYHYCFWLRLLLVALLALGLGGCSIIPNHCRSASVEPLTPGNQAEFEVDLNDKCNRSGIYLEKGAYYWFEVDAVGLLKDSPVICNPPGYTDADIDCCEPIGPEGYLTAELPLWRRIIFGIAAPFRPMNGKKSRWLEAVGRIADDEGDYFSLVTHNSEERAYKSNSSGELLALVNDFPWFGRYANNCGMLRVKVYRNEQIKLKK